MYEIKLIKEYPNYDLYAKYKDGKFLYRLCLDRFQVKEIKEVKNVK